MGLNIVQIGSHKGNDDLYKLIKNFDLTEVSKIILVEPQSEFNHFLHENYHSYNHIIENVVINNDESLNKVKFYSCLEDKNKEISSLNINHLHKHNQTNFIEREFTCMTLNKLLSKHNIKSLDLLFIDAEGFDDKIIESIDFVKFDIKRIFYENLHIDNTKLKLFLESKNYIINERILTNGWTNEAIKKY
jgi:FkbM family methyltransferase